MAIQTREEANFYQAARETFQTLYYPSKNGLTEKELDPKYVANTYDGETQINQALYEVYKYKADTATDVDALRRSLEGKLWPGDAKVANWTDVKRRAATDPSWIWHHPRALDELKDELIRRDTWRDSGGGFIERGPFPQPAASVTIQVLGRDPDTGEVKLRVKPLHADRVHWANDGAPSPYAPQMDSYDITTKDLTLSFLAVDSTGEHQTAEPFVWRNEIAVKHRFYQHGDALMCELRAIPSGALRYTVDGSSPDTAGLAYVDPFAVPAGTKYVIARASADGVESDLARFEVGEVRTGPQVDPAKPAVWKRRFNRDATGEVYAFLDQLDKHRAWPGGVGLAAQREQRWVEFRTHEQVHQEPAKLREQAGLLVTILGGGNITMDLDTLQFAKGQDLLDLVADLKTALKQDEVEQAP